MTTSYYYPKMPKWIVPELSSLAYLDINLIEITEEDLCTLGELCALLSLELTFKAVQKDRLVLRGPVFPCLKEFNLFPSIYGARATYLKFEEGAMPKLEKLDVPFFVSAAKEYGVNLGIDHLPCLKHATITLENEDATYSENKAAAAAIRNEANAHPNHPRVFVDGEMEETDTDEEESCTDEEES
jgi:disease resistance protein RPM1